MRIAFASSINDQPEIFVVSLNDPSEHVRVTPSGGNWATWDPNADRLYYLWEGESPMKMYAVDFAVNEAGEFVPEVPEVLFELEGFEDVDMLQMNPDGTRFYVTRDVPEEGPATSRIPKVVLEWDELIGDLLPEE